MGTTRLRRSRFHRAAGRLLAAAGLVPLRLPTSVAAPAADPHAAVTIAWDAGTRVLVQEDGRYGRMIRLGADALLCAFERGGDVHVRTSRDGGRTWGETVRAADCPHGAAANPELLRLRGGAVLLAYNERPGSPAMPGDGVHPYAIRTRVSRDGGRTWGPPVAVHEAGREFENGCWEPAAVQLPDGEIRLFFANEGPYRGSNEQEIAMARSRDGGATWDAAKAAGFRPGHRDGMPVPLLLRDGSGIAVAIEDNGLRGRFKPAILLFPLPEKDAAPVGPDAPRRWGALADPLPPTVYAGAPYLVQLPSGETLLGCQSDEGGRAEPRLVVYVGSPQARRFLNRSVPFDLPPGVGGLWNALFVKDGETVTALSTTRIGEVAGLWAVDGRVVRRP